MIHLALALALACAAALLALAAPARAADPAPPRTPVSFDLDIDATNAPRGLFHASVTFKAEPGPMEVCFVEWTPGNHNPSGPIQNVVEFFVRDAAGNLLHWDRDEAHLVRHRFTVPRNSPTVRVEFTYLANQPSPISRSTDSYGHALLAGLNWNTVLVYPASADKDAALVRASITLPKDWRLASSLPVDPAAPRAAGNRVAFAPVSLARLVDSPVIMGRHLASHELPGAPAHFFHAVARKPELTTLPEARLRKFARMAGQAARVFGPFPFSRFDFLAVVSDEVPGFAVEHAECTFLSMPEKSIREAESGGADDDPMTVLSHEYIHAWNGKLVVPEGLLARNFHTPALTRLLWVYEGLTTHYDDVIAVRAGMISEDEFTHIVAQSINSYELQTGRLWRSVEDTARAMRVLREASPAWGEARRRQDYYGEGALFWLEADAIIRSATNNAKSLDDFCIAFFKAPEGRAPGAPLDAQLATYTRQDVVDALAAVHSAQDWDALIRERIELPAAALPLAVADRLGLRMDYADEPTALQKKDEKKAKGVNLRNSLGFAADENGRVTAVLRGSPADKAGLGYAMKIVAVDEKQFAPDALRDAVRRSRQTKKIDFLVNTDGETLQRVAFTYDGGLRYPRLVPVEGRANYLHLIAQPR